MFKITSIMKRRQFIGMTLTLGITPTALASLEPILETKHLKIGLTPVFLDDQVGFLHEWKLYLENHLNMSISFVQRNSYESITAMLLKKELDLAWICGYPYVKHSEYLRLIATPFYQNSPNYQAYIIVASEAKHIKNFSDLKNTIFAYSDPNSNSGYVYVQSLLKKYGHSFFKKAFFTYSHRKSIQAVAQGVAVAASVDGYVWETLKKSNPELVSKTRVLQKSEDFGFPPIVTHSGFSEAERSQVGKTLMEMSQDVEGRRLLAALNITDFRPGQEYYYHSIRQMIERIG